MDPAFEHERDHLRHHGLGRDRHTGDVSTSLITVSGTPPQREHAGAQVAVGEDAHAVRALDQERGDTLAGS